MFFWLFRTERNDLRCGFQYFGEHRMLSQSIKNIPNQQKKLELHESTEKNNLENITLLHFHP